VMHLLAVLVLIAVFNARQALVIITDFSVSIVGETLSESLLNWF